MQVTEPAQSTLRQGDSDWALLSLLSDSDVSYILIPFDIFESAQAAHVKCIQSIVITDVQVPRLRSDRMLRGYANDIVRVFGY